MNGGQGNSKQAKSMLGGGLGGAKIHEEICV